MLLSVVVPVYNGEKYLGECLTSLSKQGLNEQDYEIIVVNDGSTDGTEDIIDSFSKSPLFKKINKINGGASSARNTGIEESRGDYITFIDADDKVTENIFATIINYVVKHNLDGYYFATVRKEKNIWQKNVFFDIDKDTQICPSKCLGGIHGVVYRKSILKERQITFDTSMTNTEDLLFNFYYTLSAKKVGITYRSFYYYRFNNESVTAQLYQNKNSYNNLKTKEYRCYLSLFSFVIKVNEYRKTHHNTSLCKYLVSVMLCEILWTSVRCFYDPDIVLNDIKENGLSIDDIKMNQINRKSIRLMIKSFLRCFIKYPLVYKTVSKVYRKLKS